MRKVILQEFVSLDGLASGRDGSTGFIPEHTDGDQSFGHRQMKFLDSIDHMLLGRVTYEMFASYWPTLTTGDDKPFADKLNAIPKTVFSRRLDRAPWGTFDDARIVQSDPVDEVRRLRKERGKDIVVWGSLTLARSLIAGGAVDEYQLVMLPVVLGEGTPLFKETTSPLDLQFRETMSFDRGAVLLTYGPAGR
jgi:dihydrofolate reductase